MWGQCRMVDQKLLFKFLTRLGDNCLILGHRNSEWCGHSPILEEDIALANIALDFIGQARLWLDLAGEIEGKGRSADDLAYLRDSHEFGNFLLTEQPNGDFAQTLLRQLLFDAWHVYMLEGLTSANDDRIAAIAEKALKEAKYHIDRSISICTRMGDGTDESNRRMQDALNLLWPYANEIFMDDEVDQAMEDAGISSPSDQVKLKWNMLIDGFIDDANLIKPKDNYAQHGGKQGVHSEHMGFILSDMQFLQRAYPDAKW